jgi:hypothetical protein
LQHENELLKIKLSNIEDLCQMCSTKMNASVCLLQEEVLRLGISNEINDSRINNEDGILMALAGLKQVISFSIIYLQES